MLMGEGEWAEPGDQLYMGKDALHQTQAIAVNAWRSLPTASEKATGWLRLDKRLMKDEEFLSRLIQAVKRVITHEEAANILIKQLAYENANTTCKSLLHPIRKTRTIGDFVKSCADVSPSYVQGVAIAVALKGETYSQCVKGLGQIHSPGNGQNKNNQGCFSCGQNGHFSRHCPNRGQKGNVAPSGMGTGSQNAPQTLCPRCQKGFHWGKECRSMYHRDGYPLSNNANLNPPQIQNKNQGNWKRGPVLAPVTIGTSSLNPFLPPDGSKTSSEQPQGAQGWTSVPPPQQY